MKPAMSVILLTVLVGCGQGLLLALFLCEMLGSIGLWPMETGYFFSIAGLLALSLLLTGLIASFFHLGRPERFWRAVACWRTSWLSREVVLLVLLIGAATAYVLTHILAGDLSSTSLSRNLITIVAVLAVALYVCTGMIYVCIKFLPQWATPLTVINFTLTGLASGFVAVSLIAAWFDSDNLSRLVWLSICLTLLALIFRVMHMWRNHFIKPKASMASAIGIRHSQISQKSTGFMGGSYNTREFFHGRSPSVLQIARVLLLLLGFIVPACLLLLWFFGGRDSTLTATVTLVFAIQLVGLVVERWYFFADANHAQNLYYQTGERAP